MVQVTKMSLTPNLAMIFAPLLFEFFPGEELRVDFMAFSVKRQAAVVTLVRGFSQGHLHA